MAEPGRRLSQRENHQQSQGLEVADIRGTDTNTADGKVLITAHVDKATNAEIEEFRWVNRCEGEAEIIRQLIARGLKAAS